MQIVIPICIAVVILVIILLATHTSKSEKSHFYTEYAIEEPTRPYLPYTGTEPRGFWGTEPWFDSAYSMGPGCVTSQDFVITPAEFRKADGKRDYRRSDR